MNRPIWSRIVRDLASFIARSVLVAGAFILPTSLCVALTGAF